MRVDRISEFGFPSGFGFRPSASGEKSALAGKSHGARPFTSNVTTSDASRGAIESVTSMRSGAARSVASSAITSGVRKPLRAPHPAVADSRSQIATQTRIAHRSADRTRGDKANRPAPVWRDEAFSRCWLVDTLQGFAAGGTMDTPTLYPARRAAADTDILPAYFPAPGLGLVPVNAFLIRAKEPVLVDTGLIPLRDAFIEQLASLLPIANLRWIWLTHADQDHVGAIHALLDRAPRARVVTTYIGLAKMSLFAPLPIDRVFLLNPGERLEAGDRHLLCLRPPTFDAPETTALFDSKTRTLFSSDSFGAVVQQPIDAAESLAADALQRGIEKWASIDAPWLECADPARFEKRFDTIRSLAPTTVLSTHLPPAHKMTDALVTYLIGSRAVPPFVGPNQQAFEQMLRQAAE